MSHFSVCVVVPQVYSNIRVSAQNIESCLHRILAPYDEQPEEAEYREFEDRTEEAKAAYETDTTQAVRFPDGTIHSVYDNEFTARFYILDGAIYEYGADRKRTEKLQTEASRTYELINDYPVKQRYSSFEAYCEEYCGYVQNSEGLWGYTHNPNAKWDWWQIGGRFPGKFLVKEDVVDCITAHMSPDDDDQIPDGYKYADGARMKDICWDLMKQIAVEAVEASYKRCVEAFESGQSKGLDFFARITDEGIMGWSHMIYVKGESLDDYKARKGVTDVDKYPVNTFAFVDRDGDWSGSGDMGWFGMSSNDKSERDWNDELQALMSNVQGDDFIVAVDCHI